MGNDKSYFRLKEIKFENSNIFYNKYFDFTTRQGIPAKKIILVGQNGTGKTKLLKIIDYFNKFILNNDGDIDFNFEDYFLKQEEKSKIHLKYTLVDDKYSLLEDIKKLYEDIFYYDYFQDEKEKQFNYKQLVENHAIEFELSFSFIRDSKSYDDDEYNDELYCTDIKIECILSGESETKVNENFQDNIKSINNKINNYIKKKFVFRYDKYKYDIKLFYDTLIKNKLRFNSTYIDMKNVLFDDDMIPPSEYLTFLEKFNLFKNKIKDGLLENIRLQINNIEDNWNQILKKPNPSYLRSRNIIRINDQEWKTIENSINSLQENINNFKNDISGDFKLDINDFKLNYKLSELYNEDIENLKWIDYKGNDKIGFSSSKIFNLFYLFNSFWEDNEDNKYLKINSLHIDNKIEQGDVKEKEIYFTKNNDSNNAITYKSLSSGEKRIFNQVYYFIDKLSTFDTKSSYLIILIDELDIALHPIWNTNILKQTDRLFNKFENQMFVATHSEIIPYSINSRTDTLINMDEEHEMVSFGNYNSIQDFVNRTLHIDYENFIDEYDIWVEGRSDKYILDLVIGELRTKKFIPFNIRFANYFKQNIKEKETHKIIKKEPTDSFNKLMNGFSGVKTQFLSWLSKNNKKIGNNTNIKPKLFIFDNDYNKHNMSSIIKPFKDCRKNQNSERFKICGNIEMKYEEIKSSSGIFDIYKIVRFINDKDNKGEIAYLISYKKGPDEEGKVIEDFLPEKYKDIFKYNKNHTDKIERDCKNINQKSWRYEISEHFINYIDDLLNILSIE